MSIAPSRMTRSLTPRSIPSRVRACTLGPAVDATSREYFINSAPSAWGPGARAGPSSRASGLSRVLSELVFDNFGVCEGGGSDGLSCEKDDDCLVLQGSGTCRFYDLRVRRTSF